MATAEGAESANRIEPKLEEDSNSTAAMEMDTPDTEDHPSSVPRLALGDMPEEVLEHILGFLSPYREMEAAKQVSRQWNRVIKSVIKQRRRRFNHCLSRCDVYWQEIFKEKPPSYSERGHIGISDRFSHSAAYHNGFMYVFGGCTSTSTTFNDLWSFDLTHRRWVRPVAMGTYPSPKACATMVVYNGNLVLYGGWSHPIPYPLHQSAHYFSELHVYSPATNRWSHVHSLGQEPEALGGHSASVAGHLMVVFGGSPRPGMGTNNLWVFNFLKASWTLQPVGREAVPEPRYGQFQTTLDENHILIMGGCVGLIRIYTDVWLLTLDQAGPWRWTKLTVECSELGAPQTWCHAACRVNNMIVVVAKSNSQRQTRLVKKAKHKQQQHRQQHQHHQQHQHQDGSSNLSSPSSSSSSSSSPPSSSSLSTSFGASGASVSVGTCRMAGPGVYVHPKLQPQQRRVQEMRHAMPSTSSGGEAKDERSSGENHLPAPVGQLSTSSTITPDAPSPMTFNLSRSPRPSASPVSSAPGLTHHTGNSLLALQQRLHRECLNLPDPDNHHHNPRRRSGGLSARMSLDNDDDDDESMPEGYFNRLQNRFMGGGQAGAPSGMSSSNSPFQRPQHYDDSPEQHCLSPHLMPSASSSQHKGSSSSSLPSSSSSSSQSVQQPEFASLELENSAVEMFSSAIPMGESRNPGSGREPNCQRSAVSPLQPQAALVAESNNSSSSSGGAASLLSQRQQQHYQPPQQQAQPPPRPAPRAMPSIRPNATSNRQKQLEALQRQEELLRSKSRALAAARAQPPQQAAVQHQAREEVAGPQNHQVRAGRGPQHVQGFNQPAGVGGQKFKVGHNDNKDNDDDDGDDDGDDTSSPALVPTKNKMDVHVLDISRALSEGVVRWGPLSELQPAGAPHETICCNLVEGRGELLLFGGVRRDVGGPGVGSPGAVSNQAVSRLYVLQPE